MLPTPFGALPRTATLPSAAIVRLPWALLGIRSCFRSNLLAAARQRLLTGNIRPVRGRFERAPTVVAPSTPPALTDRERLSDRCCSSAPQSRAGNRWMRIVGDWAPSPRLVPKAAAAFVV